MSWMKKYFVILTAITSAPVAVIFGRKAEAASAAQEQIKEEIK